MNQRQKKSAKDKVNVVYKQLSETIADAAATNGNMEMNGLRNLLNQLNSINPNRVVLDQATLVLPNDSLDELPPRYPNVRNDAFYLECCIDDPAPGYNPCPCASANGPGSTSVRATGHINWYLSFTLDTFFNNGADDCEAVVPLRFSQTGTTCVNQTICQNSDECPDFCNGNTVSLAFRASLVVTEEKVTVTYIIVHFLPDCE